VAHGYDAVTMRKVADAIEYSPTTIYLHFKDKEELIRSLCLEDFLSLAKAFQRIGKEKDPVERIRKAGLAYVDFGLRFPKHYELMFMRQHAGALDPEAKAAVHGDPEQDAFAFLLAAVTEAMAAGRLRPELDDPQLVAQALWANVHGVVALDLTMREDSFVAWRGAKTIARTLIEATLRGLLREAERSA
jgi:AcrR family transcriptional regulator